MHKPADRDSLTPLPARANVRSGRPAPPARPRARPSSGRAIADGTRTPSGTVRKGHGPDPGDSMSRRHLGGLAAAALVGAALAAVPHGANAAAPTHGQSARALAAQSARQLVASKPPALKVSAHDAFRAKPVVSSHGIQYAAYDRTYRGLPVVGGDFVVVTELRRPDPQHLRGAVPQGPPPLRRAHPGQGRSGAHGAAPGPERHRQHSGPPRRLAAQRHVPARLGDAGHRAPGSRALDQGRRRQRPQRQGPAGP